MISDKNIKDIFFKIEKTRRVFDYQIEGVSIYFILRFLLEMDIRSNLNKDEKRNNPTLSLMRKLKSKLFKPKANTVKRIDYSFDKRETVLSSKYLFVGTCAWTNHEGANIDLYDIIKYYFKKGESINFIQPKYFITGEIPTKSKYYHRFLPLNIDQKKSLSQEEYLTIKNFCKVLKEECKVDLINKVDRYFSYISLVMNTAKELENYIQDSKASYVLARSVYTEPWVAIACHKTKTKLIEVQHGVVGPENIYYQSSISQNELKEGQLIMPDYIITLGDEWSKILIEQGSFFNSNNTFTLGSSEFNLEHTNKSIDSSESIRLVFYLQGGSFGKILSLNDFITNFMNHYIKELTKLNISIVVRPHPNNPGDAETLEKNFDGQIIIEDPNSVNAIESIKKSDYVVSATSMCLYEALAFGKTAISFSQFADLTVKSDHIKFIKNVDDLYQLISNKENRSHLSIPYLTPFKGEILEQFK